MQHESDKNPPGFELMCTLQGDEEQISSIAWVSDAPMLASGSWDETVRLWDVESGELRQVLGGLSNTNYVSWSPDSRTVAIWYSNTIKLWDVEARKIRSLIRESFSGVNSVAWSPDGQTLAFGSSDGMIRLWDVKGRNVRRTFEGHYNDTVNSVAWYPDGQTLAYGSNNGIIRILNAKTWKLRRSFEGHYNDTVNNVAWSPDGQTLASQISQGHDASSLPQSIELWNAKTGQRLSVLKGYKGQITSTSFSSDSRLLASRSYYGNLCLWRCDTWEKVVVIKEPHIPPFSDFAFHPKMPILAAVAEAGIVIHIWNLDIDALLDTDHAVDAKREPGIRVSKKEGKDVDLSKGQEEDYKRFEYKCRDKVYIPGTIPMKRSNLIDVNGNEIGIADYIFVLFLSLVAELRKKEGGWVHVPTLMNDGRVTNGLKPQTFSNLRTQLKGSLLDKEVLKFIQNDGSGNYRVSTHPDFISYDKQKLINHPNPDIRKVAEELP